MIITFNVETMRLGPHCIVGEPRSGGITEVTVPVRGRAWTYTEASSQAKARLPFYLRPICHLSNTCSDGTMVLAHKTSWVCHRWTLTPGLSMALADHEVPCLTAHPLAFPTGSDSLGPYPGAQVR